jgi:alkanesulfonate monooxygenase SsuD/methylene tetrahydromethanopterin reductase-like flavin-dependent oxidoreductase (luciferase family)
VTDVGFACSGTLSIPEIAEMAAEAEDLGYTSVWITVLRDVTDPVAALHAALGATETIVVGLGLVPLDAFPAAHLAPALGGLAARAIVGLGVGLHHRGAASFWRAEAAELRSSAPDVRIAVGSYGTRVLREGGRAADAVLLNWMTPERVAWALRQVDDGARAAGRARPPRPAYVYVPTGVGPDARDHLRAALNGLAAHDYHRRHQARIGDTGPLGLTVSATTADPPEVPAFGGGTSSVVLPTGPITRAERRLLMRACRPRWRRLAGSERLAGTSGSGGRGELRVDAQPAQAGSDTVGE